jgi:hypothetical protein
MQFIDYAGIVQWYNSSENERTISLEDFEKVESYSDENTGASICKLSGYFKKLADVIKLNINEWTYTSPPRMKKQLKVREIVENEREGLNKIVEAWHSIATDKADQYNLLFPNVFYQNLPQPFFSRCPNIFQSSFGICEDISSSLKNCDSLEIGKVYICYSDESGTQDKIEAITTVYFNVRSDKRPYLFIGSLATHPKNLISSINNQESDQVSGAAAKLINHLVEVVCPQSNLAKIKLVTTKNARSFYEKLGFRYKNFGMKLKINPQST